MVPPTEIHTYIDTHDAIAVFGHKEPDGDCISSQIVLASMLERLGKRVVLYNPGPFDRKEIRRFGDEFVKVPEDEERTWTASIVVDCSSGDRLGIFEETVIGLPIAVIDHHAEGDSAFGDVRYIDTESPATTLMIQALFRSYRLELTEEEAQSLFFGFATDTGFFRFLDSADSDYLRAAADLLERGASPRSTYADLFHGKPWQSRKFLSRALDRAEFLPGGHSVLTYFTIADSTEYGRENRDGDSLYSSLLAVEALEVVAVVREETEKRCTVSFRSTGTVNVGKIASQFGGGGHKAAAGCSIDRSLIEVLPVIRRTLSELFSR